MRVLLLVLCVVTAVAARAGQLEDIVRYHAFAIGGAERIEALAAFSSSGSIRSSGPELRFELLAQRPNRMRIALQGGGHASILGWDGQGEPWQFDPAQSSAIRPMPRAQARGFEAEAEFDDPLIAGSARGYTLDYAGEQQWEGRPVFVVLVTRSDSPPSRLLVEQQTYFIVARLIERALPSGRKVTFTTRYSDFRPVGGVLLAFRIEELADGKLLRDTIVDDITPLEHPAPALFEAPATDDPTPSH